MLENAKPRQVLGRPLVCPVCQNGLFYRRQAPLGGSGADFLSFDAANTRGTNYICDQCGYMFWFYPVGMNTERLSNPREALTDTATTA